MAGWGTGQGLARERGGGRWRARSGPLSCGDPSWSRPELKRNGAGTDRGVSRTDLAPGAAGPGPGITVTPLSATAGGLCWSERLLTGVLTGLLAWVALGPQRLLAQVAAPVPAPVPAPAPAAISPEAFAVLLRSGDLDALDRACPPLIEADDQERLRKVQERLLAIHPAPQPLPVVLANADVMLRCGAPLAAMTVLNRISPAVGAERVQWLVLQWRAANAALDHRRAALALERLAAAQPALFPQLGLPVLIREDGTRVSRSAQELLADHLHSRGLDQAAGELLLASRLPGVAGAERLQQAVRLLPQLPLSEREALLEEALEQAAAAGAWGLVGELLDDQAALPSPRARERRRKLSPRIDDAYGEWLLNSQDPAAVARRRQLEQQLRSPRAPGGHAASGQPAFPPASSPRPASPSAPSSP